MKRLIAGLLVLLMAAAMLPAPASAAVTGLEMEEQIVKMYSQIRARSGRSSLNGYCGLMTAWQVYLTGIDTTLSVHNGRDEYDTYRDLDFSTGGYRVRPFPGNAYTLEEALNSISRNGTRDVFNILVGLQWTHTEAGRIYGHACFIHGIVDGVVYYMEGFDCSIGGKFFPAGTPIKCSIRDFAQYYNRLGVFEGLIYFGKKSFADECLAFSSNLLIETETTHTVYSDVPGADDNFPPPAEVRTLRPGECAAVTGVYQNWNGMLFYEIHDRAEIGYIAAADTHLLSASFADVQIWDVVAPRVLAPGEPFCLEGRITASENVISGLRVAIIPVGETVPVYSIEVMVLSNNYLLTGSYLSEDLLFDTLAPGKYMLEISADVMNNFVKNGALDDVWQRMTLWHSEFLVGDPADCQACVSFQGQGGTITLDQAVLGPGQTLSVLPEAQRGGCAFCGWYTQPVGGVPVRPGSAVEEDTVYYAHWAPRTDAYTGWDLVDNAWVYFNKGQISPVYYGDLGAIPVSLQVGSAAEDPTSRVSPAGSR